MDVVGITSAEQVHLKKQSIQKKTKNEKLELLHLRFSPVLLFCLQDAIFRVVAAILHLGNIEFAKGKEMDSSTPQDEKSWFHLKTAAELFM